MLMSALGVGIGVGVGLGLASGTQAIGKWAGGAADSNGLSPLIMEEEMIALIGNGRDYNVSFDQFPYYLRYGIFLSVNHITHNGNEEIRNVSQNSSRMSHVLFFVLLVPSIATFLFYLELVE